jgi:diguanylate cyclase
MIMSKSQASNGRGQAAGGSGASAGDMIEPDLALQLAPIGMQGSSIDGPAVYSALLDAHADQVRERVMSTQRTGDTMRLPQLREANAQLLRAALEAASLTKLAVREYAALARTSSRDALTHTPDRALMQDRLEQAVSLARRRGNRIAVFFIDLDDFKQINDTLGHAAGDEALRLVARRLEAVVRDSDTVSRHGGDEFLVLLTDVGQPSDATAVAASVLAALAEPAQVSGHAIVLSASLGVAIFPDDGDDVDSLVARADAAMYQAKYAGGQRFICCRDPHAPGAAPAGGGNGASRHARERKHSHTVEHSAGYRELREANARLESAARSAHENEARARQAQHPQIAKLASARAVLRQPLEPIRRAAALLEHAHADKGLLTRLQGIIEGQLARLSLLIDEVHGGAAASARKPGDERGTVDLLDILYLAVAQSGRTLTARRQTLTRQIPPGALRVRGDAARLAQAFSGLLANASAYTAPGGAITLSARMHAEMVTVTVANQGLGLSPHALPGNRDSLPDDSVAMGSSHPRLAVVRDLVQAYGGTVAGSSAGKNQGSALVVTLPKA